MRFSLLKNVIFNTYDGRKNLKVFSLIVVRMFCYLAKVVSSYVVLFGRNKKEKSSCTNRDAEMDGQIRGCT